MRCKNCGTDNNDNRYICENCGSPLYDEDSIDNSVNEDKTQAFKPVTDEKLDLGYTPDIEPAPASTQKQDEKKSIIVIAILAVVLVAIIVSVIVVANAKRNTQATTVESTTTSDVSTSNTTKRETTTETTTKETTTKETTTKETTTTTTTQLARYSIKLVSKGGGTVSGSGTYNDGDNVTISAIADDGYTFEGWYSNGDKISSTSNYSFTATENLSISAVFIADEVEELNPEELE